MTRRPVAPDRRVKGFGHAVSGGHGPGVPAVVLTPRT
jgi:hypothetical protein